MTVALLIIAFSVLVAYEAPEMMRRKEWGELALFAELVFLAFVVSLLQTIGIRIPNPIDGIKLMTRTLAGLFR